MDSPTMVKIAIWKVEIMNAAIPMIKKISAYRLVSSSAYCLTAYGKSGLLKERRATSILAR